MLFALKRGDTFQEYYAGGSHQAYGEKQPNVCHILESAKKYRTEKAAENAMKRINDYATGYLFYIIECTGHDY